MGAVGDLDGRRRRAWREPTTADLRAIEAEWPLIAAELAIVNAEIVTARVGDGGDELSRRRSRREAARLLRTLALSAPATGPDGFGGAA
jgi:hypothetical protein